MKKIYIVAGEPSGDLQASKLMKALNKKAEINWLGVGGDKMIAEGLKNPIRHCREMAFIGFFEVLKNLPQILKNLKDVKAEIAFQKPDAVILIDYPGFNLKLAKFAKQQGLKVIYYITPQLWAWHKSRVYQMRDFVDHIINIFPFEVDFYNSYGIKSHYFGHPLTEGLSTNFTEIEFRKKHQLGDKMIIGILPGSRDSEVFKNLPIYFQALQQFSKEDDAFVAVVAKVNSVDETLYTTPKNLEDKVRMIDGEVYDIMAHSHFVLICSGTATLETACFKTPMIVTYQTSTLTYIIAKWLVKIEMISLVNIVRGKLIVPELIQHAVTSENIVHEIKLILGNRDLIVNELTHVYNSLKHEHVSDNVANFIDAQL
jgi:lipid-A-disaccharide synthase